MERFERERKSKEVLDAVESDLQEGLEAGVRGTPTIFVNGRLLQNRSLQGFQQLIDRILKDGEGKGKGAPR